VSGFNLLFPQNGFIRRLGEMARAFEKIGIPTVPSKQDPLDDDVVAHHTNMDVTDRVPVEDMNQAVTVSNAPEMMPRVANR
jgi:hypothetical protein